MYTTADLEIKSVSAIFKIINKLPGMLIFLD